MEKLFVCVFLFLCIGHSPVFGQFTPKSKSEAAFKVYKEYDKNGKLIRYDSSQIEKEEIFHKNFKIFGDSLHFLGPKMEQLQLPYQFFLFKDMKDLDSLSINFLKFDQLEIDSILKHTLSKTFHYRNTPDEHKMDSLLERHFKKMEKLFERLLEKESKSKIGKQAF
ncbi:MAG: hypothetical protein ACO349_00975 [Flavobacteriaceae bacterium]